MTSLKKGFWLDYQPLLGKLAAEFEPKEASVENLSNNILVRMKQKYEHAVFHCYFELVLMISGLSGLSRLTYGLMNIETNC